jgi:hypothetical protein
VQASKSCVEVRARLFDVCVPEHLLYLMQRPSAFQQAGSGLVPEIVEVEVDCLVRGPRFGTELARPFPGLALGPDPHRGLTVRLEHCRLPRPLDALDAPARLVTEDVRSWAQRSPGGVVPGHLQDGKPVEQTIPAKNLEKLADPVIFTDSASAWSVMGWPVASTGVRSDRSVNSLRSTWRAIGACHELEHLTLIRNHPQRPHLATWVRHGDRDRLRMDIETDTSYPTHEGLLHMWLCVGQGSNSQRHLRAANSAMPGGGLVIPCHAQIHVLLDDG